MSKIAQMNNKIESAPTATNAGKALQFYRTALCKDFEAGRKCVRGVNCTFAHGVANICSRPVLSKTKMCPNKKCDRVSCTYAHQRHELVSTGPFWKTKMCKFGKDCKIKFTCRFAHTDCELRDQTHEELDFALNQDNMSIKKSTSASSVQDTESTMTSPMSKTSLLDSPSTSRNLQSCFLARQSTENSVFQIDSRATLQDVSMRMSTSGFLDIRRCASLPTRTDSYYLGVTVEDLLAAAPAYYED